MSSIVFNPNYKLLSQNADQQLLYFQLAGSAENGVDAFLAYLVQQRFDFVCLQNVSEALLQVLLAFAKKEMCSIHVSTKHSIKSSMSPRKMRDVYLVTMSRIRAVVVEMELIRTSMNACQVLCFSNLPQTFYLINTCFPHNGAPVHHLDEEHYVHWNTWEYREMLVMLHDYLSSTENWVMCGDFNSNPLDFKRMLNVRAHVARMNHFTEVQTCANAATSYATTEEHSFFLYRKISLHGVNVQCDDESVKRLFNSKKHSRTCHLPCIFEFNIPSISVKKKKSNFLLK